MLNVLPCRALERGLITESDAVQIGEKIVWPGIRGTDYLGRDLLARLMAGAGILFSELVRLSFSYCLVWSTDRRRVYGWTRRSVDDAIADFTWRCLFYCYDSVQNCFRNRSG